MKVTRSLVAGGTALAVMFAAAPAVAPVASAQLSSGPVISTLIGIVSSSQAWLFLRHSGAPCTTSL